MLTRTHFVSCSAGGAHGRAPDTLSGPYANAWHRRVPTLIDAGPRDAFICKVQTDAARHARTPMLDDLNDRTPRGVPPRRRGLSDQRRSGRLAHPDPQHDRKGQRRDDPQRDAGPRISRPARHARMSRPGACRPSWACGCSSTACWKSATWRPSDRERLDADAGRRRAADVGAMLDRVGTALSAVTHGASLVLTPKHEAPIRHIEFVGLAPDRALVVLVFRRRPCRKPAVHARRSGRPPRRCARPRISSTRSPRAGPSRRCERCWNRDRRRRQELDSLAAELVEAGTAIWDQRERQRRAADRARSGEPARRRRSEPTWSGSAVLFDDLERKRTSPSSSN